MEAVMTLHTGLDTVGIASLGFYSETYGAGEEGNIANLYVSFGLLEDAPNVVITPPPRRTIVMISGRLIQFISKLRRKIYL